MEASGPLNAPAALPSEKERNLIPTRGTSNHCKGYLYLRNVISQYNLTCCKYMGLVKYSLKGALHCAYLYILYFMIYSTVWSFARKILCVCVCTYNFWGLSVH
jgi:hypothetical protein